MRIQTFVAFLTLLSLTSYTVAETADQPSTARAYRAHLMTFIWPEDSTSEKVDYQLLEEPTEIQRLPSPPQEQEDDNFGFSFGIGIGAPQPINPFEDYQKKLSKEVTILSNQMWPMIFEEQGSIVERNFHSEELLDGYPLLIGDISIKLGRYLETDIHYLHYQFNSYTVPDLFGKAQKNNDSHLKSLSSIPVLSGAINAFNATNSENNARIRVPTAELHQPAAVLSLDFSHKTASKKLNYLDHPIIGSLLYFEPISLEEAEQEMMLNQIREEETLLQQELTRELTNNFQ